ncbi:MAG: nucleoside 2-deoxyribosyltransferase, partial [Candidatus Micrarchaeota archaeon]|nr:nucleoside 2-deoxyribosyltransferase [Candidatus Micrarchaeota archaeon]
GGRQDQEMYAKIVNHLKKHGDVLTEHVAMGPMLGLKEKDVSDQMIYDTDTNWLRESDVVVAEVTTPSIGVGYELGIAETLKKPILCLFRPGKERRLSAMVSGNKWLLVKEYKGVQEAFKHIDDFLANGR